MSTKLTVFGALFAREILRVDSPVSKIIYVPQVQDSRGVNVVTYLWDKIWRDIAKKRPQCDPCLKLFRPPDKFIPVMTHFLPGYHFSTVMKDFLPPYWFTTTINPFTSIIKLRPWWNTSVTSISIFHLDETFSTKILIHCRDATFSTSTELHNHKETFQTSIGIFYRAISSQPSWFIRTVTDLNVVSLTVSYQLSVLTILTVGFWAVYFYLLLGIRSPKVVAFYYCPRNPSYPSSNKCSRDISTLFITFRQSLYCWIIFLILSFFYLVLL